MLHTQIFKRAVEHAGNFRGPSNPAKPVLPIFESTLFVVLVFIGAFYFSIWHYITTVFMTLTVVESAPSITLNLDPSRAPLTGDDEESAVIETRNTRITSGVRSTFRHLRSQGGFYAPLRGAISTIYLSIIYFFIMAIGGGIASIVVGEKIGMLAGVAIASVATAKWNMALTQLRIASAESNKVAENKNIFKRGKHLTMAAVKPTVAALTLIRLYQETFNVIAMNFVPKKGDPAFEKPYTVHFKDDGSRDIDYGKVNKWFFVLTAFFYIGFIAVVLPAKAVVVRMQASGMAPEDDTIIAVDKTFGVEAAGEKERTLTFVEALRTFSREDIRSIVVMGMKLIGLETVQLMAYCVIVYVAFLSVAEKAVNNAINAQFGRVAL
jgi:hypothetical protein